MPRVLITAFGPYRQWKENASWLALIELTRDLPTLPEIVTRLYPVDFDVVRERLTQDLMSGYDYALHLGQAPGASSVQFEAMGINVKGAPASEIHQPLPLIAEGPPAYQSDLPLGQWAAMLREAGIPSRVSYHAGTYLCNATLYLTHHLCQLHGWRTQATFVHLPLATTQAMSLEEEMPSLPSSTAAWAIRLILEQIRLLAVA